jgi:hypothetical protein
VSLELAGVLEFTNRSRSPLMIPTLVAVPCSFVCVVLEVPSTVVLAPSPMALAPMTMELLSELFRPLTCDPM